MHSEKPKLYTILAFLSAEGLNNLLYKHVNQKSDDDDDDDDAKKYGLLLGKIRML